MAKKLFVVEIEKDVLLTHDGEFQLGYFRMDLDTFLQKSGVEYEQTYWIPDVMSKRYKRVNYQKHLESASIGTKEDTNETGPRFI
jgi:hypothetical protein